MDRRSCVFTTCKSETNIFLQVYNLSIKYLKLLNLKMRSLNVAILWLQQSTVLPPWAEKCLRVQIISA